MGKHVIPFLEAKDIPEHLTEKACIGVEIDSQYEIVKFLAISIKALMDQGINDISIQNPLMQEIIKRVPKIDVFRTEMAKKKGFDCSKKYHPLALFEGVVHYYSQKSEFFGYQLSLIRGRFQTALSDIDSGRIASRQDLDSWAKDMEDFHQGYYKSNTLKQSTLADVSTEPTAEERILQEEKSLQEEQILP